MNRRLAIIVAIYLGALLTAAAVFEFAEGIRDRSTSACSACAPVTSI